MSGRASSSEEELNEEDEQNLSRIERGLELLGIFFVQDQLNNGFIESLSFLTDAMVRIAVLSGDSELNVRSVVNLARITAPQFAIENKVFHIQGFSLEEISISIKKTLAQLKDFIS